MENNGLSPHAQLVFTAHRIAELLTSAPAIAEDASGRLVKYEAASQLACQLLANLTQAVRDLATLVPGSGASNLTQAAELSNEAVEERWEVLEILGRKCHLGLVSLVTDPVHGEMVRVLVPRTPSLDSFEEHRYSHRSVFGSQPITRAEMLARHGWDAPQHAGDIESRLRTAGYRIDCGQLDDTSRAELMRLLAQAEDIPF